MRQQLTLAFGPTPDIPPLEAKRQEVVWPDRIMSPSISHRVGYASLNWPELGRHKRAGLMEHLIRWALLASFALAVPDALADDGATATRARLLDAQASLGSALLQQVQRASPSDVIVVSPASVAGSLTAVFLGADAATRAALAESLKLSTGHTALSDLDALKESLAHRPPGDELSSAARIVFAPPSPPTPAASDRLAAAGVDVAVEDLQKQETIDDINSWAAQATHEKITKILDRLPPNSGLVALNALFFAGHWMEPFDDGATEPGDFTTAAGAHIRVPFMHGSPGDFARREDADFVAVDLPFEDRRFSMVLLTTKERPTSFTGFIDHLGWLSGTGFGRSTLRTVVDLPRFQAAAKLDLLPALMKAGLKTRGPFPNLTSTPVDISAISQTVDLDLNEQGATVAAVTVTGFRLQAEVRFGGVSEFIVDKPFAFALREEKTGVMIAEGFVEAINGTAVAESALFLSGRSKSIMSDEEWARLKAVAPAAHPPKRGLVIEQPF